jgi:hypothetical protein
MIDGHNFSLTHWCRHATTTALFFEERKIMKKSLVICCFLEVVGTASAMLDKNPFPFDHFNFAKSESPPNLTPHELTLYEYANDCKRLRHSYIERLDRNLAPSIALMQESSQDQKFVKDILAKERLCFSLSCKVKMRSMAIDVMHNECPPITNMPPESQLDADLKCWMSRLKRPGIETLCSHLFSIVKKTAADHPIFGKFAYYNVIGVSPVGEQYWYSCVAKLQLLQQLMVDAKNIDDYNEYREIFLARVLAVELNYKNVTNAWGKSKCRFGYETDLALFILGFGDHLPTAIARIVFGLKFAVMQLADLSVRFNNEAKIAAAVLPNPDTQMYTVVVPHDSPESLMIEAGLNNFPDYPELAPNLAMACTYVHGDDELIPLLFRVCAQGRRRLIADGSGLYKAGTVCTDMASWLADVDKFKESMKHEERDAAADKLHCQRIILRLPNFTTGTVCLTGGYDCGRIVVCPSKTLDIAGKGGLYLQSGAPLPLVELADKRLKGTTFSEILRALNKMLFWGTILEMEFTDPSLDDPEKAENFVKEIVKELRESCADLRLTFLTEDSDLYKENVSTFPQSKKNIDRAISENKLYQPRCLYQAGSSVLQSESSNPAGEPTPAKVDPARNPKPPAATPAPVPTPVRVPAPVSATNPSLAIGRHPVSQPNPMGPSVLGTSYLERKPNHVHKHSHASKPDHEETPLPTKKEVFIMDVGASYYKAGHNIWKSFEESTSSWFKKH